MKRRVREIGALAGLKNQVIIFSPPLWDAAMIVAYRVAVEICKLLDRNPDKAMTDLHRALPLTYASPTMSPYCPDTDKYNVLDRIIARIQDKAANGETFAGRRIDSVLTVNGARIMLDNGAWGLVRASSNTPNLVVVCESPESDAELRQIFADLDAVIRTEPLVGAYDQTL